MDSMGRTTCPRSHNLVVKYLAVMYNRSPNFVGSIPTETVIGHVAQLVSSVTLIRCIV